MEDRVALREGNIFTDPIGGPWDAALVSNIVHGEDVETNRRFMRKVFDALSPGGLIVVKDHLMDRSLTKPAGGAVSSSRKTRAPSSSANGRTQGSSPMRPCASSPMAVSRSRWVTA